MGWTPRSVAVSLLLAMENHRREAGLRLVRLREDRGWSQETLAYHSGVSVKTISRFENGRHDGRRSTVEKLAKALEVDERLLMGERPTPLGLDGDGQDPVIAEIQAALTHLIEQVAELLRRLPDEAPSPRRRR